MFSKGEKKTEPTRVIYEYKFIDTPRNIWDRKDVDEILSFDDLEHGFDENFRKSLEEAGKNKYRPSELTHEAIEEYMEDCDHMQVIMSTIDLLLHGGICESTLEDDCKKDVSTFFVNVPEEVFITIFFKEYIEPGFNLASSIFSGFSRFSQAFFQRTSAGV